MYEEEEDLPVTTKTNAVASTSPKNDDLDVDWGDEDALTKSGLDRIKPADASSKVRTAVLTDVVKTKMAWLHYVPTKDNKKATVRCMTKRDSKHRVIGELGLCCKTLNNVKDAEAQLNFAALALRYKNADPSTGGYKGDADLVIQWELAWLKLSRAGFKAVSELILEGEKAEDFDFTVSMKDNGIGYDYKRKSKGKPLFRQNPALLAEVMEEAKAYADGAFLKNRLGKEVTELDFKALVSVGAAGGGSSSGSKQIDDTGDL